jgi:hypothetical protein
MKVYKASEKEMDERLELDKRRTDMAFCICFESLEEAPAGFYKLQDKIRDGLEEELMAKFKEGFEPPRFEWSSPSNKWFYFDTDMHGSERIEIELTDNIIGDKLLGVIMAYLEKCESRYCVIGVVYRKELKGKNYMGRFVITRNEIAVEESLAELWTKQVQFLEIEER